MLTKLPNHFFFFLFFAQQERFQTIRFLYVIQVRGHRNLAIQITFFIA